MEMNIKDIEKILESALKSAVDTMQKKEKEEKEKKEDKEN